MWHAVKIYYHFLCGLPVIKIYFPKGHYCHQLKCRPRPITSRSRRGPGTSPSVHSLGDSVPAVPEPQTADFLVSWGTWETRPTLLLQASWLLVAPLFSIPETRVRLLCSGSSLAYWLEPWSTENKCKRTWNIYDSALIVSPRTWVVFSGFHVTFLPFTIKVTNNLTQVYFDDFKFL